MVRRRTVMEAVLAEAGCDHLVFCGAQPRRLRRCSGSRNGR